MGVEPEQDRVFNRRGRRHFRRSYSLTEVKVGGAVGVLLALIAAWVVYKGRHPDPALLQTAADLMSTEAGGRAPSAEERRGPLPEGLAPPGWREQGLAVFDATNLYEKINGREGYFKGFGFRRLYFVSLGDPARAEAYVDLELYNLDTVENAIGALAGELPQDGTASLTVRSGAVVHAARNAVFLAKGGYYARLIGADESETVRAALTHARATLEAALPSASLPLGYDLFAGLMQIGPDRIAYVPENAFSFGFASQVHTARLADESELFVVVAKSAAEAKALAGRFRRGFLEYGEGGGDEAGVSWVRDRYLGAYSGAGVEGRLVIGVRGAPDRRAAVAAYARLSQAAARLPPEALVVATSSAAEGGTGEH